MARNGNVVNLVDYVAETDQGMRGEHRVSRTNLAESPGNHRTQEYIDTGKLYEGSTYEGSSLAGAIARLDETIEWLDAGIAANRDGNPWDSDNAMSHVKILLPELFCFRDIGDSFGAVISACYHALRSTPDAYSSDKLVTSIVYALRRIRREPLMNFSEATSLISGIREHSASIAPDEFGHLMILLNG